MTEAYGFDSYNQCCWPEIEPTIHSHGGGDSVPKCFVRKSNVINSSGGGIAGTLDSHYWKGCGERQGAEREFIAVKKRGVDDLPKDNRASDGK